MGDVFLQDLWFHQAEGVVIEKAVVDGDLTRVRAPAPAEQVTCRACGTTSDRVHSRYVRRLTDTAVAGLPVVIELQVRRFRCRDRACGRATFAEQVDGLTFRHGRRNAGLQMVLQRVAVMLAGRAGPGRRPPGGHTRGPGEPLTPDLVKVTVDAVTGKVVVVEGA